MKSRNFQLSLNQKINKFGQKENILVEKWKYLWNPKKRACLCRAWLIQFFPQEDSVSDLRRLKTKILGYILQFSDFQSKVFKTQTQDIYFFAKSLSVDLVILNTFHYWNILLKSIFTCQEIDKIFDDVVKKFVDFLTSKY